jgi:hypothetical protein
MTKYKIISTIRYLNVTDNLKESFSLMPGIELITEKKTIKRILDKEFGKAAGMIEYDHYKNANHILYCDADESIFSANDDSHAALTVWLVWLEMLLTDSWLIKDNAMICESAYCRVITNTHAAWTSNRLESSYSLSTGHKNKSVDFSLNELKLWEDRCHKFQVYLHKNNSSLLNSFVDKEFSRIGRALRFITSARKESNPAMKIAHYCSALESIFSTEKTELSHKLSERVALFLKDHSYNALDTFDKIKSFYNIRSKVTHGSSLSKQGGLSDLSIECDTLLRDIINITLSNQLYMDLFHKPQQPFELYFKNQLFGE